MQDKLKASYTVEASVLMSITFFVLTALLVCTFYLHDRTVMQSFTCEVAAAGSNMATSKEQEQVTSALKKSFTKQRLLGSRNVSGKVTTGNKKTSASWSGEYPVPGIAMKFLTGNKLSIEVSWSSESIQPADTIRKIRGIKKLINGGGK